MPNRKKSVVINCADWPGRSMERKGLYLFCPLKEKNIFQRTFSEILIVFKEIEPIDWWK